MIKLSIIIPCYNEEKRLTATYLRLLSFFRARKYKVELCFINDGSSDKTLSLLKHFSAANPAVTVLSYPQNKGKGYAVRQGLLYSRYFTKVILDADLSIGPEELNRVNFKEGWSVMKGDRVFISEPPLRRVLSWAWHLLIYWRFRFNLDTQAPFTVLRLPRQLYKLLRSDGFAYDVELLYSAARMGYYRFNSLKVLYEYKPGSRVTMLKTVKMLKELWEIKKNKR